MTKIHHLLEYVDGDFDTATDKLVCVGRRKYGDVALCFEANMNVQVARIKLHSRDRAVDANNTFDDAWRLGKEIERRWNAALPEVPL